eukprot:c33001_g1_i1.p1 GENE.c33001_g1_i1~~c33001_g1_i1.p1  ORF type:complete len:432 (+),score=66.25 c33001_g1_i1:174-1469(+)
MGERLSASRLCALLAALLTLSPIVLAASSLSFSPSVINEGSIRTNATTLVVRLPVGPYEFNASMGADVKQLFISSTSGDSAFTMGWNFFFRNSLLPSAVTVSSNTTIAVSLQAMPVYEVPRTEVVQFVIPAAMLLNPPPGANFNGSWSIIGQNDCVLASPLAVVTGPTLVREADIVAGGVYINITLKGTVWAEPLNLQRFSEAFYASTSEHGWSAVVKPALDSAAATVYTKVSSTRMIIRLPPVSAYSLDSFDRESVYVAFSSVQIQTPAMDCGTELRVYNNAYNATAPPPATSGSKTKIWGWDYLNDNKVAGLKLYLFLAIVFMACCCLCIVGGGIKNRLARRKQVAPQLNDTWDPEMASFEKSRSDAGRGRSFKESDRRRSGRDRGRSYQDSRDDRDYGRSDGRSDGRGDGGRARSDRFGGSNGRRDRR